MTKRTQLVGCKPVNPVKSVGQNVAILLRKKLVSLKVVKIYEPSDTINMIGVRFELKHNGVRFYTAHLKQLSINSRSAIIDQFEELRLQFRDAERSREGMLIVFDANVHVGDEISGADKCMQRANFQERRFFTNFRLNVFKI